MQKAVWACFALVTSRRLLGQLLKAASQLWCCCLEHMSALVKVASCPCT